MVHFANSVTYGQVVSDGRLWFPLGVVFLVGGSFLVYLGLLLCLLYYLELGYFREWRCCCLVVGSYANFPKGDLEEQEERRLGSLPVYPERVSTVFWCSDLRTVFGLLGLVGMAGNGEY